MTTTDELLEAIAELKAEIEGLRRDHQLVASESHGHFDEVRCRRLVVIDEDGFERVVAETLAAAGSVKVNGKPMPGEPEGLAVSMVASEETLEGYGGFYVRVLDEDVCGLAADFDGETATTRLGLIDRGVSGDENPRTLDEGAFSPRTLTVAGACIATKDAAAYG